MQNDMPRQHGAPPAEAAALNGNALNTLARHLAPQWGWIALRGIAGVLFGIMAIVWPLAAIWSLAVLWGAFALADGLFSLMTAWQLHQKGVRWWPYVALGLIGVLAGFVTLAWPAITAVALVYVIAFWALFGGVSQIAAAIRLRKEIEGEWFLILAGGISALFGLLILFRPLPGVLAIAWVVGFYALTAGMLHLLLAFRLRQKR